MPHVEVRITDNFIGDAAFVYSDKLLDRIELLLESLTDNPELGSQDVRESLVERYGDGLRKIDVSTFLIIYRYEGDHVDVLALAYRPNVRQGCAAGLVR